MEGYLSLLLFTLIPVGVWFSYLYYQRNRARFVWSATLTILAVITFITFPLVRTSQLQKAEIKRVIILNGGQVTDIQRVSAENSPINRKSSRNTIYRIKYSVNGLHKTAWYRAINNASNIHSKGKKALKEEWVFE